MLRAPSGSMLKLQLIYQLCTLTVPFPPSVPVCSEEEVRPFQMNCVDLKGKKATVYICDICILCYVHMCIATWGCANTCMSQCTCGTQRITFRAGPHLPSCWRRGLFVVCCYICTPDKLAHEPPCGNGGVTDGICRCTWLL